MKDYVKRMIEEYKELSERKEKLYNFINDDNLPKTVEINHLRLMFLQHGVMEQYLSILKMRLSLEDVDINDYIKQEE